MVAEEAHSKPDAKEMREAKINVEERSSRVDKTRSNARR